MYVLIVALLLMQPPSNQPVNANPAAKNGQQGTANNSPSGTTINVPRDGHTSEPNANDDKHNSSNGILHNLYEIASIIGALATVALFCLIRIQTNFMRHTLHLSHRPKILVRNIVIPEVKLLNRETPMNEITEKLTGYYMVANTGGVPAKITRLIEGTWAEKGLPMERPDRAHEGRTVDIRLEPGESKEIKFEPITLDTWTTIDLVFGAYSIFFLVQVEYVDEIGITRRTSASRQFNTATQSFTKVENPDYEYAD